MHPWTFMFRDRKWQDVSKEISGTTFKPFAKPGLKKAFNFWASENIANIDSFLNKHLYYSIYFFNYACSFSLRLYLWKFYKDCNKDKHWNMYITICKTDDQCKLHAWSRAFKAGTLGQPRGMGWGGRTERGFRMGGHMYTHGWFMLTHGKNHHNTVK